MLLNELVVIGWIETADPSQILLPGFVARPIDNSQSLHEKFKFFLETRFCQALGDLSEKGLHVIAPIACPKLSTAALVIDCGSSPKRRVSWGSGRLLQ